MCEFSLNGAPCQLAAGSTLLDLVESLALRGQALALAVNRSVVRRADWPARTIADGDRVEVVRAIGGG
ncbi:sulfur carrier protein ThiS [Massilia sp. DWR3-1-1]|jgi:sulfur carrier protein|uniref:sulfur carrier protein ThiS n=1 Tax=Massilia sp. DWR3-1-1 TaxID=2804559 RepID=UPI003CF31050